MARSKRRPEKKGKRSEAQKDKRQAKDKKQDKGKGGNGDGSQTEKIKKSTTQGECPVITQSPTAAAMAGAPDADAFDDAVYSTGPGEAVMYQYSRQGTYADEFASQQAQQSAVPAGVSVTGPGQ